MYFFSALQEFSQALVEDILKCFLMAARNLALWDYLDLIYFYFIVL